MNNFSQVVMRRRLRRRYPVGMVAGMLTGSLATIIGVACGIDPFAVCTRALISGAVVGIPMSIGMSIVRAANLEPDPAWPGALPVDGRGSSLNPTQGRG